MIKKPFKIWSFKSQRTLTLVYFGIFFPFLGTHKTIPLTFMEKQMEIFNP
jgi:hypothetical protein